MTGGIRLDGRTIVVTGGARGLGEAFSRACCAAGAKVLIGDILDGEGQATRDALRAEGFQADFHHLDISDPVSVQAFADRAIGSNASIDGLLNNAALATGIGGKIFEELDIETWDRVMAVNVKGPWLMTRAFSVALRDSTRGGRVVNLASDTALWGAPRLLHYVASKGAVISMTRSLAREMGADGVAVNALAPGLVRVEATEYVPEERKQLYVDRAAINRAQLPTDTVGAAVFLLSDAAAFVSGQIIPINGGFI